MIHTRNRAGVGAHGLRPGSGRIETDFPILVSTYARRELHGVIGDGQVTIQVNTGSGSVRLRSLD